MFPILSPLIFFGLPLFHFLFLCLSVLLLSFFLPSCLSFLAFFFFLVFVSFFLCSFFCAFVSWKEQHENIKLEFLLFINPVLIFVGFLSCFLFEISFSLSLFFFLILSYVFCSTSLFLAFKKPKLKNTTFWVKKRGGCNITGFFFMNLCFAKCEKLSFLGGGANFLAIFWLFFKKHYKNRHFSTFFEAKNYKKNGIFGSYYLVQVGSYYLVQVDCVLKNANLDQIITSKISARSFFSKKKGLKPLYL